MKKTEHSLKILSVFLLLFACLGLFACGTDFAERYANECTVITDALVADDMETAYALFDVNTVPKENFTSFWKQVSPLFQDAGTYTVRWTGSTAKWTGDMQLYSENHLIRFDESGKLYQLGLVGSLEGGGLLLGIRFDEVQESVIFGKVNDAPVALRILFAVISLVTFAFVLWMLIDCIRRPLPKKGWWILLILVAGCSFGFTRSTAFSIQSIIQWNFLYTPSNVVMDSVLSTLRVSLYIPLGAIIYFFSRKKMTPRAPEVVEFPEETEPPLSAEE